MLEVRKYCGGIVLSVYIRASSLMNSRAVETACKQHAQDYPVNTVAWFREDYKSPRPSTERY